MKEKMIVEIEGTANERQGIRLNTYKDKLREVRKDMILKKEEYLRK